MIGACAEPGEGIGEVTQATAPVGLSAVVTATGALGQAEVQVKWQGHNAKVKGSTVLTSMDLTIQPGGHSGWHSHGGIAFVTVVQGTATLFDHDTPCTPEVFPTGTAFFDPGGSHVHILRNLGGTPLLVRVQFVNLTGTPLFTDAPAPATCP